MKERMFIREYTHNGGNARGAAMIAYNPGKNKALAGQPITIDNRKTLADGIAQDVMKRGIVQHAIKNIMDKQGLTDSKLVATLKKGIDAPPKDERIDWYAKHRFLETALKLKGHYEDIDKDSVKTLNFLNIFFDGGPKLPQKIDDDFLEPEVEHEED